MNFDPIILFYSFSSSNFLLNQKVLNKLKMRVYVLMFLFYFKNLLHLFEYLSFASFNHALYSNLSKNINKKVVK